MSSRAHEAYVESRVLSANPIDLVRMLYQAALGAVREARRFVAEGRIAERSQAISKACDVLMELRGALDHQRGGEISGRLAALYSYMLDRLLEANMQQSDEALADVFGLLSTLSEAWDAIRPTAEPAPAVENRWTAPPEAVGASASQSWSL